MIDADLQADTRLSQTEMTHGGKKAEENTSSDGSAQPTLYPVAQ